MKRFLFLALFLASCAEFREPELSRWDPPKTDYRDPVSGCQRYEHDVRGPDAYDLQHEQPYHCEAPQYDPDNADIDPVSQ